jgi:hypothetical protein
MVEMKTGNHLNILTPHNLREVGDTGNLFSVVSGCLFQDLKMKIFEVQRKFFVRHTCEVQISR